MKNYPVWAAMVLILMAAIMLVGDTGNWHMNNLWVAQEIYVGSSYFTPTSLYVNGTITNGAYAITTSGNFTVGSAQLTGAGLTLPSTASVQIGTSVLLSGSSITLPGGTVAGNLTVSGSTATLPATSVSSLKINGTTINPGGGGTASCSGSTHVTSIVYSVSASGVISLSTTCS